MSPCRLGREQQVKEELRANCYVLKRAQIKYRVLSYATPSGYGWQAAHKYGSDNSLKVNWNADNGLNVYYDNLEYDNWNYGAVAR
jgi:hypothetical protein